MHGERVWLAEKPSFAKELGKALGNCQPLERYAWQSMVWVGNYGSGVRVGDDGSGGSTLSGVWAFK